MDCETASPEVPLLIQDDASPVKHSLSSPFRFYWKSCTCVALSGALLTSGATCALKILANRVSVFQILCIQSLIALPFLLVVSYCSAGTILGQKGSLTKIAIRGMLAAIDFIVTALGITLLPLSTSSLLANTGPAFVAVILWIVGMERPDLKVGTGVVGTVAGLACIVQPPILFGGDEDLDAKFVTGCLLCIIGNIFRALGLILVTQINAEVSSIVMTNSAVFCVFVLSLPFALTGYPMPFDSGMSGIEMLLCLACAAEYLNQLCIVRSFQIGPSMQASALSLARVLILMALGAVVFSEQLNFFDGLGVILLLASMLLIVSRKQQPLPREHDLPIVDDAMRFLPEVEYTPS